MGQERSRVQRPLRPTLRPRTATRSGFVSFSGLGLPKPETNQNVNTTRIPYKYTNQEKWHTFESNGWRTFHKNCFQLCDVIFEAGSSCFWEESHSSLHDEHAEVKALELISTTEQQANTVARSVKMYSSYSPCANCADFIIEFSTSRPHCQLSVFFSCLYKHTEDTHRDGLRRLNAAPRIFLRVFANKEWKRVADATGIPFQYHSSRRLSGALKWKAEFENILREQPGTTALRPSMPSQKTDWTTVIIQPTHIPQDQRPTVDAATSSGLSQGRASQMWWQSHDVQQEELLDVVMVETAEGDVAVTRSVTNQSVCYGILIVAIVLIGALVLYFAFR